MPTAKIGLLADTHGRLDPALWKLFDGANLILHAGDIGEPQLLRELGTIAPVEAVRGNTDAHTFRLPEVLTTEAAGVRIHIRHKVSTEPAALKRLARRTDADVVLFGHTHRPFVEQVKKRLFVNPGSASKSRTGTNTAGILTIADGAASVTIHGLAEGALPAVMVWPAKTLTR